MKNCLFPLSAILCIAGLISCESSEKKSEGLAKQYCSNCHIFPDPSLLDKKSWENGVLPQMAFRMGIDFDLLQGVNEHDLPEVMKALSPTPMVTEDQWERIREYYLKNAPDSLTQPVEKRIQTQSQFDVSEIILPTADNPLLTMVEFDSIEHKIFIGSRLSKLYQLSADFVVEDSFKLYSAPSDALFKDPNEILLASLGIMDPNDQAVGRIVNLNVKNGKQTILIDSIKRPVNIQNPDLNNDGENDFVVSAFGNYTGALVVYEKTNAFYKKHVLSYLPGTRKTIIRDFNGDGLKDILALITQGDEQITLFTNRGNFNFTSNVLLRFPPVYGSSYFEIYDFNKDGYFDILYTNGDNADYSSVFKPYHGVRIFLNNGKEKFTEDWFYPMYGASEALANDFDSDGDLDIVAISFFPDFKKHPEHGFLFFENTNGKFTPYITPKAAAARWLSLEQGDFDRDGDTDVALAALNFTALVPDSLLVQWKQKKTSILLLKNKLHQRN